MLAKRLSGLGLKLAAGSQRTINHLVSLGWACGGSLAIHCSQGSSSARSIGRAPLGSSAGGQSAVTKPMCSPSRGANPLSLKASSTAGRARSRDSPCSLYGPASTITASSRTRSTRTRSEDPDLLGSVTLRRSSAKAQISCDSATPFLATPASICASSNDFCFCATLIGSCHKRASTSCAAMTGIVFSLATAGRVLTSGLYCATTPARTAMSGNSVAQGTSNFGLSLFAMVASARGDLQKIGSR